MTQPQISCRPARVHPVHADDNCGRAPPPQSLPIHPLSLEQAISSIEAACPSCVFLVKGTECCVCLDSFGLAAESVVATGGSGQNVAELLRSLDPPITTLRYHRSPDYKCSATAYALAPFSPNRCGHTLHRSCVLQVFDCAINGRCVCDFVFVECDCSFVHTGC